MSTLLFSILFVLLPLTVFADDVKTDVVVETDAGNSILKGKIDICPGETTTLETNVSDPSYTYIWSIGDEDKVERFFTWSTNDNKITVTHLNNLDYALIDVYCTVVDSNGNVISSEWAEIVVQP